MEYTIAWLPNHDAWTWVYQVIWCRQNPFVQSVKHVLIYLGFFLRTWIYPFKNVIEFRKTIFVNVLILLKFYIYLQIFL